MLAAVIVIAAGAVCHAESDHGLADPCATFLVMPGAPLLGFPPLVAAASPAALLEAYDLQPPDLPAPPPKA